MAIGMAWQQQEERLVEGGRAKGQPAEEGRQREEGTWPPCPKPPYQLKSGLLGIFWLSLSPPLASQQVSGYALSTVVAHPLPWSTLAPGHNT